jgi:hypothetical protein
MVAGILSGILVRNATVMVSHRLLVLIGNRTTENWSKPKTDFRWNGYPFMPVFVTGASLVLVLVHSYESYVLIILWHTKAFSESFSR